MDIRKAMVIIPVLALAFGAAAADTLTLYQCSLIDKDGNVIRSPGTPLPVTYQVKARSEEEARAMTLDLAKQDKESAHGAKCFVSLMK